MRVICYGDSTTYGFDPRSYFGGRYAADARWVDLLEEETGWKIQNEGENGRSIPRGAIRLPADTGLLIVMLGSNDLLQGLSAEEKTERMERFLSALALPRCALCLLTPPVFACGSWIEDSEQAAESRQLAIYYEQLARRQGISCIRTDDWAIPLCFDGVHFTGEGHRLFAKKLLKELMKEKETPSR